MPVLLMHPALFNTPWTIHQSILTFFLMSLNIVSENQGGQIMRRCTELFCRKISFIAHGEKMHIKLDVKM